MRRSASPQLCARLVAFAACLVQVCLPGVDAGAQRAVVPLVLACGGRGNTERRKPTPPASVPAGAGAAGCQALSSTSACPLISGGIGRPRRYSMVGAMSSSAPVAAIFALRPTYTERYRVDGVRGGAWRVSLSNICSALPWSAVISIPPTARSAS